MPNPFTPPCAAGNRLMHRRLFLQAGAGLIGGSALLTAQPATATRAAWMKAPGRPMSRYGAPCEYEAVVGRIGHGLSQPGTIGSGAVKDCKWYANGGKSGFWEGRQTGFTPPVIRQEFAMSDDCRRVYPARFSDQVCAQHDRGRYRLSP